MLIYLMLLTLENIYPTTYSLTTSNLFQVTAIMYMSHNMSAKTCSFEAYDQTSSL